MSGNSREVPSDVLDKIVVEDLGLVDWEVINLKNKYNFKGMKILQLAVGKDINYNYLPCGVEENSIFYMGTHDNQTFMGYLKSLALSKKKKFAKCLQVEYVDDKTLLIDSMKKMIECKSEWVIFQMQDLLMQDNEYRMNIPSKIEKCWRYKMPKDYEKQSKFVVSKIM